MKTVEERFWAKVDKSGGPDACWKWKAARNKAGYGRLWYIKKTVKAHRLAWELVHGPIPDGEGYHGTCVLHRCDNPPCCNPAHLFLGTQGNNVADKVVKGRQPVGGKCPHSKLTEEQVQYIRALYAAGGATNRGLGRRFGVSGTTIHCIVTGKKWKNHFTNI